MVRCLAACSLLFGVVWAGLLPSLDDTTCATPEEEQLVVVGAGICRIIGLTWIEHDSTELYITIHNLTYLNILSQYPTVVSLQNGGA